MAPEILLLAEPTTGLDEATVERMITLLGELEIGYLIVSHEFDFLRRVTSDIYSMGEGKIRYLCRSDHL
jgi:cobalt/nickel transport system ATP-binding protein